MKRTIFIFAFFALCLSVKAQMTEYTITTGQSDKRIIYTEDAPKPIGPYSQAVQAGNMLFVSGQIALDTATGKIIDGDIQLEAEYVMKNVKAVVEKAGFKMRNIVKTTIFLTDLANFKAVNEVYAQFFSDNFPARETVQVVALPKGAHVEISVIAVR